MPPTFIRERGASRTSSSLPGDLVDRAVRRVGVFATVVGATAVVEGLVSHLPTAVDPEMSFSREDALDMCGVVVLVVVSAGMAAYARTHAVGTRRVLAIGYLYMVVLAYFTSLTDHADYFWRGNHALHGVPVVSLLILMFPVLVPTPPLRALIVALAMAVTGPLALWTLSYTLDYEKPGPLALWGSFPWLVAVVASVMARIVHQLGVAVQRAQQLGAYTLEEKLGAGGMGEIWRARHRFLARPAAVKLITPTRKVTRDAQMRFEREAQVTASLKSPHTVQLYDFGFSEDGVAYYVMELLDGLDLQTLVNRFGAQPAARVVHWLKQACHSLKEAHAAGLIHRDIKPANLLVLRYGTDYDFLKVLDFGLVSFQPRLDAVTATLGRSVGPGDDSVRGTPGYMAPETVLDPQAVDERADIYALGCVAFWLLSGKPVFEGENSVEIIASHINDEPRALSDACEGDIPKELEALVARCLAKSPSERPRDAQELFEDLSRCQAPAAWTQQDAAAWWGAHVS